MESDAESGYRKWERKKDGEEEEEEDEDEEYEAYLPLKHVLIDS